ncbi:MAG: hypothetical protein P1U46_02160 [Patescibacteria group bacterium]|nr:hypothetical protein [Patescibacteria group bacterium]
MIFEISIFSKESSILFVLSKDNTDLNSGQLVRVAKTRNHIIHFGALDASAVKLTIGSKKYQLQRSIAIPSGK